MLEKETLSQVLTDTGCTDLPSPLKTGDVYIRAIVKVLKANNHEAMCIAVNDGTGKPIIKKSYGSISMIKEVLEIYPLSVLKNGYIPDFRKKQDVENFLVTMGESQNKVQELIAKKDDESRMKIKQMVIFHCVKRQLATEDIFGNAKGLRNAEPKTEENTETKIEEEENGNTETTAEDAEKED